MFFGRSFFSVSAINNCSCLQHVHICIIQIMPAWTELEIEQLLRAVEKCCNENRWQGDNKYDRRNVPVWRAIKIIMGSNRDYKSIRHRYKQQHDPLLQQNVNRILTQQEERTLHKFVDKSPGGTVRYRKGFEAAATQLKLPVANAKKRFVRVI